MTLVNTIRSRKFQDLLSQTGKVILLFIFGIPFIVPLIWLVSTALKIIDPNLYQPAGLDTSTYSLAKFHRSLECRSVWKIPGQYHDHHFYPHDGRGFHFCHGGLQLCPSEMAWPR